MNPIPEPVPISDLRLRQNEVLNRLCEQPVVLISRSRAAAVLVHPEQWNRLIEQLEDLQLALDAVEARREGASPIDFEKYLAERGEHGPATVEQ